MRTVLFITAVACATIIACSNNSSNTKDAPSGHNDAPHDTAAQHDSPVQHDAPAGTAPLTVLNYLSWCSVTVGSGSASASSSQVVNEAPGTVTLSATALSGFKLGDWHHTNGDTGTGDPGTVSGGSSTAMVTMGSAAKCVWVCCPFTDGTGCPSTDQCSGGG